MDKKRYKAMSLWNSGADKAKFISTFPDGEEIYNDLESRFGCASIPIHILLDFRLTEPTDEVVRRHRGLSGNGLLLKQAIREIYEQDN